MVAAGGLSLTTPKRITVIIFALLSAAYRFHAFLPGGGGPLFFFWYFKNLFLLHCVPLYVCRLCINYQDLRTNLLGMAAFRILLLTFMSHFVIDSCPLKKL